MPGIHHKLTDFENAIHELWTAACAGSLIFSEHDTLTNINPWAIREDDVPYYCNPYDIVLTDVPRPTDGGSGSSTVTLGMLRGLYKELLETNQANQPTNHKE